MLAAFLVTWLFIRTSARLMRSPRVPWWPGSVETKGGLHIHHLVFGITLLMLTGFLIIALDPTDPWFGLLAALFGVGMGLTLDEFALWLHLQDVYWSAEGRQSVDAVVVATLIAGLVLIGATPFGAEDTGSVVSVAVGVGIVFGFALITLLKGKIVLGIAALFIPIFGIVGAVRLAKPTSPWARWRYPKDSRRRERAVARDNRYTARYRRWSDRLAGAPSKP